MPTDDSAQPSEAGHDASLPVPVVFPLHEAIALGLLFLNAPDDTSLVDEEGTDFGASCDYGALRLAEAVARATGRKEALLHFGALRARMAQEK